MLTRKDFNALASALSAERASPALIEAVANVCANDNTAFNRAMFRDAASAWLAEPKAIAGANPASVRFPVLGEDIAFINDGAWAHREAA